MRFSLIISSFFLIAHCANNNTKVEKDLPQTDLTRSDTYFTLIPKEKQPTFMFIEICKSLKNIDCFPEDSTYKFKIEKIRPPKGVDTLVWNESNYIRSMWSIEFYTKANIEKQKPDFRLTEMIFGDQVLNQRKSEIPVAIFGTFFSSSNFYRIDSSVIYIDILKPEISDYKKKIQMQIDDKWMYKK